MEKKIKLTTKSRLDQLKLYLQLTDKFHKTSGQELDVLALVLDSYLSYTSKGISEDEASSMALSTENRRKYKSEVDVSSARFQNIIYSLRKKGVLDGWVINKAVIPNSNGSSTMSIQFTIDVK